MGEGRVVTVPHILDTEWWCGGAQGGHRYHGARTGSRPGRCRLGFVPCCSTPRFPPLENGQERGPVSKDASRQRGV